MTEKQEMRKLTAERKRCMARVAKIDIRTGQLAARMETKAKKGSVK